MALSIGRLLGLANETKEGAVMPSYCNGEKQYHPPKCEKNKEGKSRKKSEAVAII